MIGKIPRHARDGLVSFAERSTVLQGERRRFSVIGESPTMQRNIEGELARR
jgi:hypothetical protein